MLNFLRDNDVTIGVILGSLLLPLIADYVKRRWDRQKEERERRVLEFGERQQAVLAKRLHSVDDITNSYIEFLVSLRFILLDFYQERLDSELGRRHRGSHDQFAQSFLSRSQTFPLRVAQYFDRANALKRRMEALAIWAAEADGAVTLLAENPPALSKEEIDKRWAALDRGTAELLNAVQETVKELAAEVKPDVKFREEEEIPWGVTEIDALSTALTSQYR